MSTPGEVVLPGGSALMEWGGGPDAGHGYGTYTINAKFDGSQPGAGIIFWPGDDQWPGQEIDMGELAHDGSGQQYGIVHWNDDGEDAFTYDIFEGVETGVFHDYTMIWTPDAVAFEVDGAEVGRITEHVPRDYDDGGMNNTIGFINNNPASTLTVRQVDYTPLGGDSNSGGGGSDDGGSSDPVPDGQASAPPPSPEAPDETGGTVGTGGEPDWNAIAAAVTANHAATGEWFVPVGDAPAAPEAPTDSAPEAVDWNALAAQVTAHFEQTGDWVALA
jgi:Glycosyl hydrolases family 16